MDLVRLLKLLFIGVVSCFALVILILILHLVLLLLLVLVLLTSMRCGAVRYGNDQESAAVLDYSNNFSSGERNTISCFERWIFNDVIRGHSKQVCIRK